MTENMECVQIDPSTIEQYVETLGTIGQQAERRYHTSHI